MNQKPDVGAVKTIWTGKQVGFILDDNKIEISVQRSYNTSAVWPFCELETV